MLDELGGEVVAAGVGALLLGHVKNEHRDGLLARHRLLGGGNLGLHVIHQLLRPFFHLEDASQVIEILIYVLQISPQLVALDGGQGHNSVLGEGVMFRVIFLTEGAGAAVDKVGLQRQDGFQARLIRHLGNDLVFRTVLGCHAGIVIGCVNDPVPQPQGHQLIARIHIRTENLLGHVGKCDLRAVLGGQGKGKSLGVCRGFRALDIPRRSRAGRRGRILAGGAAGRQAQGEGEGQGYELFHDNPPFLCCGQKNPAFRRKAGLLIAMGTIGPHGGKQTGCFLRKTPILLHRQQVS